MNCLPEAIAKAKRSLDSEGVELAVCDWVADRLGRMGPHLKEVQPTQIMGDLHLAPNDGSLRKVLHALDVMSLSAIGILEIGYELYESDSDMAMPVEIAGEEITRALKDGFLISPRTGLRIEDFRERVGIVYRVADRRELALC